MSNVYWFYKRHHLNRNIWPRIRIADTVLDIGCGIRPQSFFKPNVHFCVEPCAEYIHELFKRHKELDIINGTAKDAMDVFNRDSFIDTVFLLNVLEHIPKHEGCAIIKWACEIARQQVIVAVPLGYRAQDAGENGKDAWGLHGGDWQRHLSSWFPENFSGDGWIVYACRNYSYFDQGKLYDKPKGIFWAIWNNPAASPAGRYASPGFITRLWPIDRLIGAGAWILKRLPRNLSLRILSAATQVWLRSEQLLRAVRI